MKAIKENRVYTITDADKQSFQREGYDIYEDDGTLIEYGAGKTVPYEKYVAVAEQVEKLQGEITALNEELESLKAKSKKSGKKSEE